jgi:hypothetical protein
LMELKFRMFPNQDQCPTGSPRHTRFSCNPIAFMMLGGLDLVGGNPIMRNAPTMIALCLLLMATFITLQETWMYHCSHDMESHVELDHGTDSDQIGHEACPIFDCASAPSLPAQSQFELIAPTWLDANTVPARSVFNGVSIWVADMGGPPKA